MKKLFSIEASVLKANARLDEVEFYNLMQAYRHAPLTEQEKVSDRFDAVKDWIKENYQTLKVDLKDTKCECVIPKPIDAYDDPDTCRDCNGKIERED